jgi:hypothetical protein
MHECCTREVKFFDSSRNRYHQRQWYSDPAIPTFLPVSLDSTLRPSLHPHTNSLLQLHTLLIRLNNINLLPTTITSRRAPNQPIQTNLLVDRTHAFLIGHRDAGAAEDNVHLLEGKPLGLGDVEPDEGGADEGQDAEEHEGAPFHGGQHVGGDLADDEIVPLG